VFVLDMGEPVRIVDLARQMIQLSGLSVRDEAHPHGDVAIRFSGLRPGEKLYEELLLSPTDQPTAHPLIRKAMEESLPDLRLSALLLRLQQALNEWDELQTRVLLQTLVPAYKPTALPEPRRLPLPLHR
jgi:FlaA1/EpsC-like NDP-sugar epimerase